MGTWGGNPLKFLDPDGQAASCSSESDCSVSERGPNGGRRNEADRKRMLKQRKQRQMRRENASREETNQNRSGEGFRDREQANRGPSGDTDSRRGGRHRERNVGLDGEEHTRVPKGRGGRGARGVGARVSGILLILDMVLTTLEAQGAEADLGRKMSFSERAFFAATGERPPTFEECVAAGNCA